MLYVGILTTQFKWHVVTRAILYLLSLTSAIISRQIAFEKSSTVFAMVFVLLFATIELIFYVQMKAQVKLFIASKVITIQEKQLRNMLDTVSDKVLVCSTDSKEGLKTIPLYNNRQMKELFGQSLVTTEARSNNLDSAIAKIMNRPASKVKRTKPFHKRVFK